MNRFLTVVPLLVAVLAVAALADPDPAQAHALFGDSDPNRPLGEYLTLGFEHMVGGWDHLLFIAGVVLLAGNWRTGAKLISLFVVGHSITLLVATLAEWQLNASVVDAVIALSLVYVGVQGIKGRPADLRAVGAIVFAFGLIHGLGLSTRLQDLGLPDSGLVERILLFNVGVEVGQLTVLAVLVGLGWLFARHLSSRPEVRRAAFTAIAAVGLVAAMLLLAFGEDEEAADDATVSSSCTASETSPPPLPPNGGHPSKSFFRPGDDVPTKDLDHVVNDGYLIVLYDPSLESSERQELEDWVLSQQPSFVVGAPASETEGQTIEVVTAEQLLSCSELSIEDLTVFRDDWFDLVRAQQME